MIRLFCQHKIREQVELEGLWDFVPISANSDEMPDKYGYKLSVPGCWEMHPHFLKFRGRGAYRRVIDIEEKSDLKFTFKGVSHTADVYFDGKHIGHHYNAFTEFSAVVPQVEAGTHELLVIVDNSFSESSALHVPNDYYTYGGIIRPVVMEKVKEVYIDRTEFVPSFEKGSWNAEVSVILKNYGKTENEIYIKGKLAGKDLEFGTATVAAESELRVTKTFEFSNVKPWSNENPQLYMLELHLFGSNADKPFDDYIDRVGFRTVKVEGQKLLINGNEVKLRGFNRHEDHSIFGAAIPFQAMANDLDIIMDLGANTVRTCHYPNDERFLDLCDERGIYVWEENHARGLSLKQMQNPNFEKQCEDCNREMVHYHFNHPSIIIWGILNECCSFTEEGRAYYKKQLSQIRDMDKSRPLTFASCHPFRDMCLDLVDIVSFNIYSGWYNSDNTLEHYEKFYEWVKTAGGNNKPIIVSEFGAGAIYGLREPTRVKWSEERQADILEDNLSVYCTRPEIVGTIIWQFCDCRVTEEGDWFKSRPGTRNNKGIVDKYRRPKLAYGTVQKWYKKG